MANEDETVIVNLNDDDDNAKLDGDVNGTKGTAKVARVRADDDDPVSDLRSQLTSMQTAVAQANRRADHAEQRANSEIRRARADNLNSQFETVVTGISEAKARGDAAEQAYATAMESGDFKLAAKHQREIATAAAQLVELEGAKAEIEASRQRGADDHDGAQSRTAPRAPVDPVEAYAAGRTAATAAWIRAHPDFVTDAAKNAKLTAAHWNAVGDGLEADTPAYFSAVEKFLGIDKEKGGKGDDQHQRRTTERRPSAPTAPVQGGDAAPNGGATQVRLTQAEAKSATDGTLVWNYDDPSGKNRFKKGDPIGTAEFARRKLEMQRQGLYDKSLTE